MTPTLPTWSDLVVSTWLWQLPELNRIKRSLHAGQVTCAHIANDALLCGWDPELELDLQQLMAIKRELEAEDFAIDAITSLHEGDLNFHRRSEAHTFGPMQVVDNPGDHFSVIIPVP